MVLGWFYYVLRLVLVWFAWWWWFSDREKEDLLSRLENGEVSDDGMESDGDDLPYYASREELVRELENPHEEDDLDDVMIAEHDEDPQLIQDVTDSDEQPPLPGTSSNFRFLA